MAAIWEPENKFDIWLKIEILASEALANRGEIPKSAVKEIKKKARFDISRIDEIEREVRHDVIAFLTSVAENVGESARFMHLGMTSSDVVDTAFAVQLKDAAALIIKGPARWTNDRFRRSGGAARRRPPDNVFVSERRPVGASDRLPHYPYEPADACDYPRQSRSFGHVLWPDSGRRPALLPVDRRQGRALFRKGIAPNFP